MMQDEKTTKFLKVLVPLFVFFSSYFLIIYLTFQTISSRHKQILPYLSRKRRSVGGFPQTSFTAEVITKITSDTTWKQPTVHYQEYKIGNGMKHKPGQQLSHQI